MYCRSGWIVDVREDLVRVGELHLPFGRRSCRRRGRLVGLVALRKEALADAERDLALRAVGEHLFEQDAGLPAALERRGLALGNAGAEECGRSAIGMAERMLEQEISALRAALTGSPLRSSSRMSSCLSV